MNKKYFKIILFFTIFCATINVYAKETLNNQLKGLILLQVEENGEAWYLYPKKNERYFLNTPANALSTIQKLGVGITNENLNKIPVGIIDTGKTDTDSDGIDDELENLIGSNPNKTDTDGDGYDDKTEIENGYNPNGENKINTNSNISSTHSGYFLIQVEENGEAWYLYPEDNKRYYVGKPVNALKVMQKLGLGITNKNLKKITKFNDEETTTNNTGEKIITSDTEELLKKTAEAIRNGEIDEALKYFTGEMQNRVEYSIDFLDDGGRLLFGNILSGATYDRIDNNKKIYSNEVYFSLGGYETIMEIELEKQDDETWLISKL